MRAGGVENLSDLDRANLYDIARGFLPLARPESILRHALLSLMGSCGASTAGVWELSGDETYLLRAFRGAPADASTRLRLSARLAGILARDPGPYDPAGLAALSPVLERWARSSSIHLACALVARGRLTGLFGLGGRLLGEKHGAREGALLREVAALAGARLSGSARKGADCPPRTKGSAPGADELRACYPGLHPIEGVGPGIRKLLQEILDVCAFDFPVLIQGETGTGKELAARALHALGPRNDQPFEAVNCAAIPRELMASALFGHERGAFTGAHGRVSGAFERAGAGTLFLDEIGDMPLTTQTLLLRVLQERSFQRVGGEERLPARARVLSATNRDLVRAVREGRFRADLFYRIQMYTVCIPPLRERREDLPALTRRILDEHGSRGKRTRPGEDFLRALREMDLPGNVRQLEAVVLGALIRARGATELRREHLPPESSAASTIPEPTTPGRTPGRTREPAFDRQPQRGRAGFADGSPERPAGPLLTFEEMQRQYVVSILELTGWNRKEAAALMKIPRTTLLARMRRLGL